MGTGGVTAAAENVAALADRSCRDEHLSTDCIAWAFWAPNQANPKPVVRVVDDVAQQHRRRVDDVEHHVDVTVVDQIPELRAPRGNNYRQPGAGRRGHFLKFSPVQVTE